MVKCKICGFEAHDISSHIRHKHNIKTIEYRERYPGSELQSDFRKSKNQKSSISPFSLDFYLAKGMNIDKAKVELAKFLSNHSNIMSNKSHFTKKYWINKGFSDDEAEKIISQNATRSLESFIQKYGEVDGKNRYEEWCNKIGYASSIQSLIDKGASENEISEFRKSKNNTSLSSFIERYGELEGQERYLNYCSNKGVTIDKMKSLYGEYEGQVRYDEWRKSCKHDLNFFITKYGLDEGRVRYDAWVESCNKKSYYSAISYELFSSIDIDCELYYGENEKKIGKYFVDLTCGKKVVEFYGDYWHCNENMFEPDEMNISIGKLAKDVWAADNNRIKYIQDKGYSVLIVWENEYIADPVGVKNKIEYFLKEKND